MIPDAFQGQLLWEALYGLAIFAVSFVLASLVRRMVMPLLGRLTANTKTQLDNYLLAALKTPIQAIIVIQGAFLALTVISLTNNYQGYINHGWKAAMLAAFFWGLQRVTSAILNWYGMELASRTQANWNNQFLPIIRRTTSFVILAAGILLILSELGFQISPLLAGLGIGGLAIALALQPTLANFVSGTYILSDGSVRTGDFVEIAGGPTGTVLEVGWRITRLLSVDNNIITIPNSKLSDSVITNFSQPDASLVVVLACSVSYETDLARAEAVCLDVMKQLQALLPEADKEFVPLVRFTSFGESNINFNLVMRALNRGASFFIKHELTKAIHARFAQEGIEMSYPVRKLLFPVNGTGARPASGASRQASSRGLIENIAGGDGEA